MSEQLFENAIALQLLKKRAVNFYKKRDGQEIDFILNREKAIEVKETPTRKDLNTLRKRATSLGIEEFALVGKHFPKGDFKDFIWEGNVF